MKDYLKIVLDFLAITISKGRTRLVVAMMGIISITIIAKYAPVEYRWVSIVSVAGIVIIYILLKSYTDTKEK